ncbi:PDZ domain-containing protein [Candidatus Pelagibacter sp.]|uniref:PDZ domain-containing protein n=1 Tax=Candidatus Pelagibacter sp. TaxID=2024849 RepID=UPI003F82A203
MMRFLRLSTFAYSLASKQKLNLFLNFVIFISIFALSASLLSMYYENKIVTKDTDLILLESKKIIVENEIPKVSKSTIFINNIFTKKLYNQSTLELLREIKLQDEEAIFINYRDIYHEPYYENISAAQVNYVELLNSAKIAKLIASNISEKKIISKFEDKIEKNYKKLIKLSEKVSESYSDWEKLEEEEYKNAIETKVGYIGIEYDTDDMSKGVRLTGIEKNSPADENSLKIDDLIIEFNGKSLVDVNFEDSVSYLSTEPYTLYNIKIKRNDKIISFNLITSERTLYEAQDGYLESDKDLDFYIKFKDFELNLLDIFEEQKQIYYNFSLSFFQKKQIEINNKILTLNSEIEQLSQKEANTILLAFFIQFLIFISSQYFEFSVGQVYEKKNRKK